MTLQIKVSICKMTGTTGTVGDANRPSNFKLGQIRAYRKTKESRSQRRSFSYKAWPFHQKKHWLQRSTQTCTCIVANMKVKRNKHCWIRTASSLTTVTCAKIRRIPKCTPWMPEMKLWWNEISDLFKTVAHRHSRGTFHPQISAQELQGCIFW